MTKPIETVIDLIRHGAPEGGTRLRGSLDDPLSELGWQQMTDSLGSYDSWTQIHSSPLKRCRAFAEQLSQRHTLPLSLHNDFREIGFGAWEGLSIQDLSRQDPDALRRYWLAPHDNTPPGGEPVSEFVARVHGAWDGLVQQQRAGHPILVCHGGVIRAILVKVLGMPEDKLWNFDVPYANVTRVVYRDFADGTQTAQLKFHQSRLL